MCQPFVVVVFDSTRFFLSDSGDATNLQRKGPRQLAEQVDYHLLVTHVRAIDTDNNIPAACSLRRSLTPLYNFPKYNLNPSCLIIVIFEAHAQ
jgi:hypothetical protein